MNLISDYNPPLPATAHAPDPWLQRLHQPTVVFYAKPLIGKWLRTFKNPLTVLISDHSVASAPWEKKLKPQSLSWVPLSIATKPDPNTLGKPDFWGQVDCMIVQAQVLSASDVERLLEGLKPGGAFVWISQNQSAQWDALQAQFEQQGLLDPFAMGFHPRGAACFWPQWLSSPPFLWLGILINELWTFVPGRSQAAFAIAPYWALKAIKRNDQTILS